MVVNILPIPGKSALAAPTLFTIMSLTSDADQSAMTAAILLYRVVTWLLPMPVGALCSSCGATGCAVTRSRPCLRTPT